MLLKTISESLQTNVKPCDGGHKNAIGEN